MDNINNVNRNEHEKSNDCGTSYIPYADLKEVMEKSEKGKMSYTLLDEKNGCTAGCKTGVTFYDGTEYGRGGIHKDQEGFFVIAGHGMARIGDAEFAVYPGISFIAPAGVHHTVKRDADSEAVAVFWFHSAV